MENHKHKNHSHWKMMLGCIGALLIIIILPFLGVSKSISSIIAIVVMILLHIPMLREMMKK